MTNGMTLNKHSFMNKSDLKLLSAVFPPDQIEWRIGQSGVKKDGSLWAKCLAYIQNRAIMDRLDEVCGPDGWAVRFRPMGGEGSISPGIVATLSVRCGDVWVEKEDGAEQTDIESFKGGLSSAMKRAAVQWGIGRYLYGLEECWAEVSSDRKQGWRTAKNKEGVWFYWNPPALPAWALPTKPTPPPSQTQGAAGAPTPKPSTPPGPQPRALDPARPVASEAPGLQPILTRMRTPGAMPTRP